MPRLKKKWMQQPMPTAVQIQNPCDTPRFPNVRQAARHFGFPHPDGAGAQAFRRWAQKIGATAVQAGNHFTYDLQQLEMLWLKQVEALRPQKKAA